ncbi:PAS domain S-box protein [Halobellus clavatus]|uniref:histidine kinase n=1 Tax=Halobellus clavatus TaxID=660517 RepID=A0A1H3KVM2_9EURY|nr:PAS domain S-box protein [Halobellus clavatus]SDY56233.1 PAS domain S-box-containing protein [Halobellus clavatus]
MADRPIRILHVDDQPDFTDLTATYLERKDDSFSIATAKSAGDGIELLRETDFDCIISDYDMPGKTGLDFLETVREDYPDLPFILFTGKGSEEVAGKAISAGATDYLQKDAGSDQYALLANRIRNYADNSHTKRQRDRQLEAMENAREPISILNDDGEFVYVNMAFAELYGYSENELLGEHWGLLYPDKDIQYVRERILPTVRAEGYWHGQTTGLRADESTFVEDQIISTTDRGDLVCTVRNATERDERERTLKRYETLIKALNDPVYALDSEGKFTFVNDAFVGLVGYERERILGGTPELIKDRSDVEIAEQNLASLLSSTGPENLVFEVEIQPKDSDPVYCEDHMSVLPYEGDEFDGSVGVLRDITERKEREADLQRYEAIIEASGDPVYSLDTDGRFTFVNEAGIEMVGYDEETLLGDHISIILDEADIERGKESIDSLLTSNETWDTFEMEVITRDGKRILCENHLGLIPESCEYNGTVGILRDITDRSERKRELERQNARLEEFTSVVSHDLRNPLSVAKGRLKMAQDECESDHLDHVESAHERMEALIGDLLTLAREGETVTDLEQVSLKTAAASCHAISETEGDLRITTNKVVRADRSRLQELLGNLFSNAIKHNDEDVTITVGDFDGGFFIGDNGVGISESKRDRVLEAGYSTSEDGTGFGLGIVKRIAKAHGWEVDVTESESGGARIEITGVEFV